MVILALLMGGRLYGFVGAFIALPLAAIARETAVYLRRHLELEPWIPMVSAGGALIGIRSRVVEDRVGHRQTQTARSARPPAANTTTSQESRPTLEADATNP